MRPNAEMSSSHGGFDLKAAREICEELLHPGKECGASCQFCDEAKTMLPAALDEIEWLIQLVDETATQLSACRSIARMVRSKHAKRIADLKAENENLREWGISNASDAAHEKVRTEKQLAALKKLGQVKRERGKALVEERAKRLVADRGDCPHRSPIKNQLISRCDKGIICDWCQCPIKDEWRDEAREQLRLEGKI